MGPLAGKVALVAGATRGAGRGIATALGEAGATVYCTGRSVRGAPSEQGRPEALEDTAALVDQAGGKGIAVRVDHLQEVEVQGLVQRIRREQGGLDLLVNDIWGGDARTQWGTPFWELDLEQGFRLLRTAVHTHLVTAKHAAPLLMANKGLLVEVTDGDSWTYRGNLFYDLAKSTVMRLAWDLHEELAPKGATALAVTPGFLRSEAVLDHFGVTAATWRDGIAKDAHFEHSETPRFVGRGVAALAADPRVGRKGGRTWASWTLAKEYGFTDADGSRPDWGAHARAAFGGAMRPADEGFYAYWGGYAEMREALGMP
jgi:NAD(P)-dependent dehydrogenase (short-subunit alcohol dehydrogenase family)